MIFKMALYGLKSPGAAFRSFLADQLHELGYKPTKADPNVWLRPAVKKMYSNTMNTCFDMMMIYYAYMLTQWTR